MHIFTELIGSPDRRFAGAVIVVLVALSSSACSRVEPAPAETAILSDDPGSVTRLRQIGAQMEYDRSGQVSALGLEGSNFTDSELSLVAGLPRLERLFLARSQVSDEGLRHLNGLVRLQQLVLPTHVTDAGLLNLTSLPGLRELALVDTQVTDKGLVHLKQLSGLERLVLPPPVTDAGVKHLTALTNLEQMDLSYTAITDAALGDLRTLGKLKELLLFGTRITDAGLERVRELTNLRTIDVSYTRVTDEGVRKLRQSSPGLEIVRTVHEPVPPNRSVNAAKAFRGEVHPLLHGKTELEVTAQWAAIGTGRDRIELFVPARVYELFRGLKPAEERRVYTERDFSAFLPDEELRVGGIWELEPAHVARFLTQLHDHPTLHLIALGRRAGPDGGYATLRAASATHYDVRFRIHAEFELTPVVWYTPAYLRGQLLINRKLGTVEYFGLELPGEKSLNVHLTAAVMRGQFRDIVHVDRMALTGGTAAPAESIAWDEAIESDEAERLLARAFYRFLEIEWVPVEQAVQRAREMHKPIFAVVLWGALDDQSC